MTTIKSSEQLNEIFSALSKAQALIDNVVSDKQAYNYKYADLGSVIAAIREPFAKHGLSVIQMPFSITEENGVVRDGLSTRICHESGQWIESEMLSPVGGQGKSAIQNMGSNITYMRRYMLAAMAGVTQVDDETKLMGNSGNKDESQSPSHNAAQDSLRGELISQLDQQAGLGYNAFKIKWESLSSEEQQIVGASYFNPKLAEVRKMEAERA